MESSVGTFAAVKMVFETVQSSATFSFLIGFLGFYCIVLLIDIILLLSLRPVGGDLKKGFFGSKDRPLSFPWQLRREWRRIEKLLESDSPTSSKVAVLHADAFSDRMLSEMGYDGNSFGERLDGIPAGHFQHLSSLREAHEIRNRIVFDRSFSLDRAEAKRILELYRLFLDESEIFL